MLIRMLPLRLTCVLVGLIGQVFGGHSTLLSEEAADLVVRAHVLCCDASMRQVDAVAIRGDRIVAVGWEAVEPLIKNGHTQIIESEDGFSLTPGLTDSHLHFVGLGQSLQMLDLRDAQSWDAIVAQVQAAARTLPKGAWIEGRGWHQSKWTQSPLENVDGYPVHTSLSQVVPDHPVVLTHASGHALFANQAAMKVANVGPETSDPPGGEILKDAQGQPIGVFRENAQSLIRRAKARSEQRMSESEAEQLLLEQVRLAGEECLRYGVTTVHDAGSSFDLAKRMTGLAEAGKLPVRIYMMIRTSSRDLEARMPNSRVLDAGNGFHTVRSVKVSIDGALGPHGAWLLQPYTDLPSSTGLNTVALDELSRIAQLCRDQQWQLCVHAIGDRANREVLDIYEQVLGANAGDQDHRWRIEHAQHLAPDDIPRFGTLGVIPAMQANHCTSDAIFVPTRLGERRSEEGAYVWRSLIDSGAIIPNGTDAPVERIDPRASLYASVTRQLADGTEFYADQCMTREEALLSYTLWPAQAAFQEEDLGSVEVGKRADLVLWDHNLLTCEPGEITSAQVVTTILAGKVVYERTPE